MEAILDRTGRVVIPHKIREVLNLFVGSELEVILDGKDIILRAKPQNNIVEEKGMYLVKSDWVGDSDIDKLIQKNRTERIKELY